MNRVYEKVIQDHLSKHRQMVFLAGPRQVGKTTTARAIVPEHHYFNCDIPSARRTITGGPEAVATQVGLSTLMDKPPTVVFDELHKYSKWKQLLKGFFDAYSSKTHTIVTGSARLNIYRRGGDSLMGRYFVYRMHPLSAGELVSHGNTDTEICPPTPVDKTQIDALLRFGGFPEPFLKSSSQFYNRWTRMRMDQLFKEDIRDTTKVQEAGQIQLLADLLTSRAGQLINYSELASAVNVSVDTIKRWISILESFFVCFTVRPWFRNVSKSLLKQPKIYLHDWSTLADEGAKHENFVACHLLKAVQWWTDIGLGKYELFYLRDKQKREVDFVVVRDSKPWFMVEVKTSGKRDLNPNLAFFQAQIGAECAFQAAFDLDYVARDCFTEKTPTIVPVSTLLSQLV